MNLNLIPTAYAQCDPGSGDSGVDLGSCLQLTNGREIRDVYNNPTDLVNLGVKNAFVFASIVLFGMIFFAGFKFIRGGTKGVEEAKNVATTALIGFVIMFSAYWIVEVVALITGADITI